MNPLRDTYVWYSETIDSYGAAEALTVSGIAYEPYNTKSINEIRENLIKAWSILDDFTVVALTAVFEAYLLQEVRTLIESNTRVQPGRDLFFAALTTHAVKKSTQRARLKDEIIKLFQSRVPKDIIDEVRTIIEYRHWIAHGKAWPKPKKQAEPVFTYKILTEFLKEGGLITG